MKNNASIIALKNTVWENSWLLILGTLVTYVMKIKNNRLQCLGVEIVIKMSA